MNEIKETTAPKQGRRRRSVIRGQRNAIIILLCVILVLAIAIPLVLKYIVNVITFTDYDGTDYKIKAVGGVYALYDTDGNLMEQTIDGYYVTSKLSTLLEIDATTGDYTVVAVVDTEDGETLGASSRFLMYNHISQDNTQSVEIHNNNNKSTYTLYRDADDDFQIKGYEGTPWKQTIVSSIIVNCGYTLTTQKISNPIKDENGEYTEYGLAKQTRQDENGNDYEYNPSWYRITDRDGNTFTAIFGDETPDGTGYYVKYTGRDAVYVMEYGLESSMIAMYDTDQNVDSIENVLALPVEGICSPVVCYPMTLTTYFDVTNFMVIKGEDLRKAESSSATVDPFICFSYWDMDERFGTFYHSRAYELKWPDGYLADTDATDSALQAFYTMRYSGVAKLGVTDDDLAAYGLDDPEYVIYFVFNNIEHTIPVSKKTANGTYYMMSAIYDMIVEVPDTSLLFLDYKLIDWVAPEYFDMYLAWAKEITVETKDVKYTFNFDNSQSDSMSNPTYSDEAKENTTISSDKMTMTATDSTGRSINCFSSYTITDKSGFTWTITADKITAVDESGTRVQIAGAQYAINELGDQVVVVSGRIEGVNGDSVESIGANKVIITDKNGKTTTYLRYGMSTFRKFYQSLLYASIEGDVHDDVNGLSDEQIAEKVSKQDENADVIITVKTTFDKEPEYKYRFYQYSERHSMITVNGGTGEFYVLRSFTDKIVSDAERVLTGQAVDPISKY